ncbi:hypothetical protein C9374_000135 [Naegleria lovaniensis]|uniref:Uncharacterized protein n=1 Tax=Naegleria lovaniensis TaxID=51637 RepID=A0AA88GUL0_NAELO|nr:uncharacterized protein C9374_000135 [Naegleria lovaniensis]KAG2388696.1 hypothetical protein C9374_000135 [Naegleria lovaniensis]
MNLSPPSGGGVSSSPITPALQGGGNHHVFPRSSTAPLKPSSSSLSNNNFQSSRDNSHDYYYFHQLIKPSFDYELLSKCYQNHQLVIQQLSGVGVGGGDWNNVKTSSSSSSTTTNCDVATFNEKTTTLNHPPPQTKEEHSETTTLSSSSSSSSSSSKEFHDDDAGHSGDGDGQTNNHCSSLPSSPNVLSETTHHEDDIMKNTTTKSSSQPIPLIAFTVEQLNDFFAAIRDGHVDGLIHRILTGAPTAVTATTSTTNILYPNSIGSSHRSSNRSSSSTTTTTTSNLHTSHTPHETEDHDDLDDASFHDDRHQDHDSFERDTYRFNPHSSMTILPSCYLFIRDFQYRNVSTTSHATLGYNCLHLACQYGHLNMVEEMVEIFRDHFPHVPLIDYLSLKSSSVHEMTPLMIACRYGHYNIVKYLVPFQKLTIQKSLSGKLPIHIAMFSGNDTNTLDIVKLCIPTSALNKFASHALQQHVETLLMSRDVNGDDLLILAAKENKFDVVEYIISLLKVVSIETFISVLTTRNVYGNDALYWAYTNQHFELAAYLRDEIIELSDTIQKKPNLLYGGGGGGGGSCSPNLNSPLSPFRSLTSFEPSSFHSWMSSSGSSSSGGSSSGSSSSGSSSGSNTNHTLGTMSGGGSGSGSNTNNTPNHTLGTMNTTSITTVNHQDNALLLLSLDQQHAFNLEQSLLLSLKDHFMQCIEQNDVLTCDILIDKVGRDLLKCTTREMNVIQNRSIMNSDTTHQDANNHSHTSTMDDSMMIHEWNYTPLHIACQCLNKEICYYLIDTFEKLFGKEQLREWINHQSDKYQWTALNLLCKHSGARILNHHFATSGTPLFNSSKIQHNEQGKANDMMKLLLEKGADFTLANSFAMRPIHTLAIYHGPISMVKLLIENGEHVDVRHSFTGYTSLHLAVLSGYLDLVMSLVNDMLADETISSWNSSQMNFSSSMTTNESTIITTTTTTTTTTNTSATTTTTTPTPTTWSSEPPTQQLSDSSTPRSFLNLIIIGETPRELATRIGNEDICKFFKTNTLSLLHAMNVTMNTPPTLHSTTTTTNTAQASSSSSSSTPPPPPPTSTSTATTTTTATTPTATTTTNSTPSTTPTATTTTPSTTPTATTTTTTMNPNMTSTNLWNSENPNNGIYTSSQMMVHLSNQLCISYFIRHVKRDNYILVQQLVKLNPNYLQCVEDDEWRYSCFHWVAQKGCYQTAQVLLKYAQHYFSPQQVKHFLNRKSLRTKWTPLGLAAKYNHAHVAKLLLEGGSVMSLTTTSGNRPIHSAAFYNSLEVLKLLIEVGGEDVNVQDSKDGFTALIMAAQEGHRNCCSYLLSRGADPSIKSKEGDSSLYWAYEKNHTSIVELLIRELERRHMREPLNQFFFKAVKKNDLYTVENMIMKNKEYLLIREPDEWSYSPLHWCSQKGHTQMAQFLIEMIQLYYSDQFSDLINAKGTKINWTPIGLACRYNNLEIAKLLVKHGADFTIPTKNGNRPIHNASFTGHQEIVKFLLDCGESVNVRDSKYGYSAVMCAAKKGHFNLVKMLYEHYGADLNATNTNGKTALQLAMDHQHDVIVKYLRDPPSLDQQLPRQVQQQLPRQQQVQQPPQGLSSSSSSSSLGASTLSTLPLSTSSVIMSRKNLLVFVTAFIGKSQFKKKIKLDGMDSISTLKNALIHSLTGHLSSSSLPLSSLPSLSLPSSSYKEESLNNHMNSFVFLYYDDQCQTYLNLDADALEFLKENPNLTKIVMKENSMLWSEFNHGGHGIWTPSIDLTKTQEIDLESKFNAMPLYTPTSEYSIMDDSLGGMNSNTTQSYNNNNIISSSTSSSSAISSHSYQGMMNPPPPPPQPPSTSSHRSKKLASSSIAAQFQQEMIPSSCTMTMTTMIRHRYQVLKPHPDTFREYFRGAERNIFHPFYSSTHPTLPFNYNNFNNNSTTTTSATTITTTSDRTPNSATTTTTTNTTTPNDTTTTTTTTESCCYQCRDIMTNEMVILTMYPLDKKNDLHSYIQHLIRITKLSSFNHSIVPILDGFEWFSPLYGRQFCYVTPYYGEHFMDLRQVIMNYKYQSRQPIPEKMIIRILKELCSILSNNSSMTSFMNTSNDHSTGIGNSSSNNSHSTSGDNNSSNNNSHSTSGNNNDNNTWIHKNVHHGNLKLSNVLVPKSWMEPSLIVDTNELTNERIKRGLMLCDLRRDISTSTTTTTTTNLTTMTTTSTATTTTTMNMTTITPQQQWYEDYLSMACMIYQLLTFDLETDILLLMSCSSTFKHTMIRSIINHYGYQSPSLTQLMNILFTIFAPIMKFEIIDQYPSWSTSGHDSSSNVFIEDGHGSGHDSSSINIQHIEFLVNQLVKKL